MKNEAGGAMKQRPPLVPRSQRLFLLRLLLTCPPTGGDVVCGWPIQFEAWPGGGAPGPAEPWESKTNAVPP